MEMNRFFSELQEIWESPESVSARAAGLPSMCLQVLPRPHNEAGGYGHFWPILGFEEEFVLISAGDYVHPRKTDTIRLSRETGLPLDGSQWPQFAPTWLGREQSAAHARFALWM